MSTSCECYLRRGVVYIPSLAQVGPGGHLRHVEPISVIPIDQKNELLEAVRKRMARAHPIVSPDNPAFQLSRNLYEFAGLKSWSPFNRTAQNWSLDFHDGIYEIEGFKLARGGAWLPDPDQRIVLPRGTSVESACARMIEILQMAHAGSRS